MRVHKRLANTITAQPCPRMGLFRTSLGVEIRKMIVADDYVTVHMDFKGHFTGTFGKIKGHGQDIDFVATDLLRFTKGRVTDNWHIEDNLTLLTEMGVAHVDR